MCLACLGNCSLGSNGQLQGCMALQQCVCGAGMWGAEDGEAGDSREAGATWWVWARGSREAGTTWWGGPGDPPPRVCRLWTAAGSVSSVFYFFVYNTSDKGEQHPGSHSLVHSSNSTV